MRTMVFFTAAHRHELRATASFARAVTLGFFDDILIPPTLLPDQCGL